MKAGDFLRISISGLIFVIVASFMIVVVSGEGYCDLKLTKIPVPLLQTPSINITPNPAHTGEVLMITGSHFNKTPYPGDTNPMVVLYAIVPGDDPVPLYPASILQDGSFTIVMPISQNSTTGAFPMYCQDKWGHKSNTVTVTILPAVSPTPTQSPVTPAPVQNTVTLTPTQNPQSTGTPQAVVTLNPTPVITGTPDTTAPVTTLSLAGIKNTAGEYTSNVVCTLTATDNEGGSGVSGTTYSFDGSNWTAYTGPFTISNPGSYTIFYHSSDSAGNEELTKAESVIIAGPITGQQSTGICPAMLLPLLVVGFAGMMKARRRSP